LSSAFSVDNLCCNTISCPHSQVDNLCCNIIRILVVWILRCIFFAANLICIIFVAPSSGFSGVKSLMHCHSNSQMFCYTSIGFSRSDSQVNNLCCTLKVPKCEIFNRSDCPDFYTINSRREGDFGVKIKKF
jgi:hypothetical protein